MDGNRTQPPGEASLSTRPHCAKALSHARRRLVELMNRLQFGHVQELRVLDGEPQFDPSPKVIHDRKLGSPAPARGCGEDVALKAEVCDLFHEFDRIGTGEIVELEFRHGLPFRVRVPVSLDR